jgi:hypothetical protein
MTFRATVNLNGQLQLGEAAYHAGFTPGEVVEVILTRSGSLILALDTTPTAIEAPYRSLPSWLVLPQREGETS